MTDDIPSFTKAMEELSRLAAECGTNLAEVVDRATRTLSDCILKGGRVLICGNGGSAADANHFAAELVGRFQRRRGALPALALVGDPSILTSIANDFGYDEVFARQVEAQGGAGDALIGISTSGHSPNVLKALQQACDMGLATVALTGDGGHSVLAECEVWVRVPSRSTPRIQEIHGAVLHHWCDVIDAEAAGNGPGEA